MLMKPNLNIWSEMLEFPNPEYKDSHKNVSPHSSLFEVLKSSPYEDFSLFYLSALAVRKSLGLYF